MSFGDCAPVSATAAATIARSVVVGELGRQVGLDQARLGLLAVGELGAAGVAKRGRGLQAALALAAQDGELVALALLGGLLQLAEDEPQRADTFLLAGPHRGGDVLLDRVDQRHLPFRIRGPRMTSAGPR